MSQNSILTRIKLDLETYSSDTQGMTLTRSRRTRSRRSRTPAVLLLTVFAGVVGYFSLSHVASQNKAQVLGSSIVTPALTVNTAVPKGTFSTGMLGVALVNWEHSWNKPYMAEVPGLVAALKESKAGVIRYAGGNWANYVGFDASKKAPAAYVDWQHNGMTYSFNYGTDEITSVQRAAKEIGAEVIVQVNISNNDPDMWAAMVQFTNFGADPKTGQPKKPIKFWEFGNELDLACNGGDAKVCVQPAEYAARVVTYQQKMLAVDPTIKFLGAGQATAVAATGTNASLSQYFFTPLAATKNTGHTMDGVTYHWYQECGANTQDAVLRYQWYNSDGTVLGPPTLWNNNYSRAWADAIPTAIKSQVLSTYPGTLMGITELNFNACQYDSVFNGNHINALWFSDVLGRLAYNGLNFSTVYTGYGTQGYSLLYPDNGDAPTKLFARPSYSAFLMYAKYFGDQMVESTSYKNDDISIWASKSSTDASKLFLRVTNMTKDPIAVPVTTNGFSANSAQVFTMKSDNPTDASSKSNTADATTKINGVKIDAMAVASGVAAIQPTTAPITGSTFTYTFPPYSSVALVLTGSYGGVIPPSPTPTSTPPSPTPTIKPSPVPTPVPSPIPTIIPSPTPKPTPVPSPIPTPIPSPVASPKPSPVPTPVPSPIPTIIPSPTPKPTPVPFAVTAAQISNTTATTATVTWTTTEPAVGFVRYGVWYFWLNQISLPQNFLASNHSVTLTSLKPNRWYYYRVYATNAQGKKTTSNYLKFRTAGQ